MAGNTKLKGFDLKSCSVVLQRWGGEVTVPISEKSKAALLAACAEKLPRRPGKQSRTLGMRVEYNYQFGQVEVSMNPSLASEFIDFLNRSPGESFEDVRTDLVEEVARILEEHKNYTDLDEPGLT